MSRLAALSTLALWTGTTLLLGELRWFRRPPLLERLRPFSPGAARRGGRRRWSDRSPRDVLVPLVAGLAEALERSLGVTDELAVRLERVHSADDVTAFRTRQLGWAAAAFGVTTVVLVATRPPIEAGLVALVVAPIVAVLGVEQRLATGTKRHREAILAELPVVAEQLGMLLSSGHSLTSSLRRIATRSHGACATDLGRVTARIAHGASASDALSEWARLVDVAPVHQLVAVLTLHETSGDLGRLIATEARSMRRGAHRRLIERIERRNQQVWIPVTVATLVPGVIFLAVPFTHALADFGAL